jgi:hypothetical protein
LRRSSTRSTVALGVLVESSDFDDAADTENRMWDSLGNKDGDADA